MNPQGKSITILYADDDPEDRMLTKETLEEARLPVDLRFVEDGEELIDYLREEGKYKWSESPRPDLILLDLNLQKKDGREVIEEVRADHNLRQIPIAVLTTSQIQEDIYRGYELDVNAFLTKPVSSEGLVDAMRALSGLWAAHGESDES